MGKASRNKGKRGELEFAKLIGGKRVPLSGAQDGFEGDVLGIGLKWEVKRRKDGFKTLYKWLENEREKPDALALKADRKPWLVVMELDTFLKLLGGNEDAGQDHRREAGVAEEGR